MIEAKGISKSFRQWDGSVFTALSDVSLRIDDGQLAIIAGENGSGKSLLMKILAGLEKPSSGTVTCTQSIGLVFQDADAQILADTVIEDVKFSLRNRRDLNKGEILGKAREALSAVGLEAKENSPSHMLSGGEKRRLAIASVMALDRRTLIFDEPYSNLDYPGVKSVNAVIEKLKADGFTILILTHELEKCLGLADRFMVLSKGKLVFDGKPEEAVQKDLESWGIRNPRNGSDVQSLVWR
ncbi:MAG: ABC transporter ATP-binding protein [Spirochaetales bacterium]|nr:ABC transporter ATP-binding protein [Spirochaetales bacterium]